MKTISRISMVVCAVAAVGALGAGPAGAAEVAVADDCTSTFIATASNPQSDAGPVIQFHNSNPKYWVADGFSVYPGNAIGLALDYATHEAGAVVTYVNCID